MTRALPRCLARVLLAGVALAACEVRAEVPAEPTRWVTDSEGFLSSSTREELDGRLETYQRQSGHHVLLWIGPTTGDVPLEDFTARAFAAWNVGREGLDDGLVLFVFADDRKVRVEVGYGLEGAVPDAIASRIIRETVVPRVTAGDRDGAMRAGIAALIAAIEGQEGASNPGTGPAPDASPPVEGGRSFGIGRIVLIGLGVIAFLVLFATNPGLAVYLLFSVLSSGRGGGGGGYSGGGGRGGGGGASASW